MKDLKKRHFRAAVFAVLVIIVVLINRVVQTIFIPFLIGYFAENIIDWITGKVFPPDTTLRDEIRKGFDLNAPFFNHNPNPLKEVFEKENRRLKEMVIHLRRMQMLFIEFDGEVSGLQLLQAMIENGEINFSTYANLYPIAEDYKLNFK